MPARTVPARRLGRGALAGFDLWRHAMRWQRGVDRALRPLGLTHSRLLVLAAVVGAGRDESEGAKQAAIAKEAGLDPVTTSTLLRALESRGLVSRDTVCEDRRSWSIALTPRGERTLAAAVPIVERVSAVVGR